MISCKNYTTGNVKKSFQTAQVIRYSKGFTL